MTTHVLLLRNPSESSPDPYDAHFSSVGLPSSSIQVLETTFCALDELQWMIETGPTFHGFKGVVITSSRSVDAWRQAVKGALEKEDHSKADWRKCPFYVVGDASAAAVRKLHSDLPSAEHLLPDEVLGGSETGTAEALAHFILEKTGPSKKNRVKLLYLTGDKNRDTLANILTDGGIQLDSVQVYETRGADGFASSLATTLKSHPKVKSWWIAFFAPSSADFALPALQEHFVLPSSKPDSPATKKKLPTARIAAIGPTTEEHLKVKLHLIVDAVASKPSPEGLASSISSAGP